MVLCPDMDNIKLKMTAGSYLLHRILGGDGILEPHPNSTGLFFSEGRSRCSSISLYGEVLPYLEAQDEEISREEGQWEMSMIGECFRVLISSFRHVIGFFCNHGIGVNV